MGSRFCPWEGSIDKGECETTPCPEWSNWGEWSQCFLDLETSLNCSDPLVVSRNLLGTRERIKQCQICPFNEVFCRRPTNATVCDELIQAEKENSKESEMCDCYTYLSSEEIEDLRFHAQQILRNVETNETEYFNITDYEVDLVLVQESGSQPSLQSTAVNISEEIVEVNYGSKTVAKWAEWSEWGTCSATCGFGKKLRTRTCQLPGVLGDPGCGRKGRQQEMNCLQRRCKLHWMDWGEWTVCSATCGQGGRSRMRECSNPDKLGEPACLRTKRIDMEPCKETVCIKWFEWTQWSPCSVSCGQGQQTRSRKCPDNAEPHNCPGPNVEYIYCNVPADDPRCLLPKETWVPPEMNLDNDYLFYDLFDLDTFTFQTTASTDYDFGGTTAPSLGAYFNPDLLTTPPSFPAAMFTTAAQIDVSWQNVPKPEIWGPWQSWSPCSLACDNPEGRRSRIRLCLAIDTNNCDMNGRIQAEKCVCENALQVGSEIFDHIVLARD